MADQSYLWDRSGEPDPEVVRLEALLGGHAYQRPAQVIPLRRRVRFVRPLMLAAAACVLLAGGWLLLRARRPHPTGWQLSGVTGRPRLQVGEWLETGTGRAELQVANIGKVQLEPDTRVRLKATGPHEHRLELARGTISARVTAPPRLFLVETPTANAVDLGCAYTLQVKPDGSSMLRVTSGYVALERPGTAAFVPEGADCETRPHEGPGTPYFDDAQAQLRAALHDFDFESGGDDALDGVLRWARPRDTLSLWHLVARVAPDQRSRVVDRVLELARRGLPAGVSRDAVLALDPKALERWRHDLETDW
jgi:hypothetical protein